MIRIALAIPLALTLAACETVRSSDRNSAFQECRWVEGDGERADCIEREIADAELDRHTRAKSVEAEIAAAEDRQSICMAYGGSREDCGDAANRGIHPDFPVDTAPIGQVLIETMQ